ncbi:unnamed protein product, partial [Trichogramma brassicae]
MYGIDNNTDTCSSSSICSISKRCEIRDHTACEISLAAAVTDKYALHVSLELSYIRAHVSAALWDYFSLSHSIPCRAFLEVQQQPLLRISLSGAVLQLLRGKQPQLLQARRGEDTGSNSTLLSRSPLGTPLLVYSSNKIQREQRDSIRVLSILGPYISNVKTAKRRESLRRVSVPWKSTIPLFSPMNLIGFSPPRPQTYRILSTLFNFAREILSEARFYVTRYIYESSTRARTDPDNLVSKGLDFYTMRRYSSSSCETDRLATDDTRDVKPAADYRAPEGKMYLMRDSEMRRSCPVEIEDQSISKRLGRILRENKPARPTITSPRSYFSPAAASQYIPDAGFILKYTQNGHFSAKLFLSVDVSNLSKFAMLFIIDMISLSTTALILELFSAYVTRMGDTIMKLIDVDFKTALIRELFSACITHVAPSRLLEIYINPRVFRCVSQSPLTLHAHIYCSRGFEAATVTVTDSGIEAALRAFGTTRSSLVCTMRQQQQQQLRACIHYASINSRSAINSETSTKFDNKIKIQKEFIEFVSITGYRDKPVRRRTTAMHVAFRYGNFYCAGYLGPYLFMIYNRIDVNYTDDDGLTHFHCACKFNLFDVVKRFLELGQDPNCPAKESEASWVDTPLYLAAKSASDEVLELLLRNGVRLDLASSGGLTPLHVICSRRYGRVDSVKLFFETIHEVGQEVQIDVENDEGWTPLQLAVANIAPKIVEVILDRGADPSRFVLHDKTDFEETTRYRQFYDIEENEKFELAARALFIVEQFEKRGRKLYRTLSSLSRKLIICYHQVAARALKKRRTRRTRRT